MKLDNCTIIEDVKKFIEGHEAVIKANPRIAGSYIERLEQFKKLYPGEYEKYHYNF